MKKQSHREAKREGKAGRRNLKLVIYSPSTCNDLDWASTEQEPGTPSEHIAGQDLSPLSNTHCNGGAGTLGTLLIWDAGTARSHLYTGIKCYMF